VPRQGVEGAALWTAGLLFALFGVELEDAGGVVFVEGQVDAGVHEEPAAEGLVR